jgi:hypothetical protein
MTLFDEKDYGETVPLTFDFAPDLAVGETVASVITVEVELQRGGPDLTPGAILSGPPAISGNKVVQLVTGGVIGANYLLRVKVSTNVPLNRWVCAGVLPVRKAGL